MSRSRKQNIFIILAIAGIITILLFAGYTLWKTTSSSTSSSQTERLAEINRYSNLSDINFDDGKVNFYIFWGDGCIHCEDLYTYLASMQGDFSQHVDFYSFEIWNNENNGKIEDYMLTQLGEQAGDRSTPTFIIGDKVFHGFNESTKQQIVDTIDDKYEHQDQIKDLSGVLSLDLNATESDDNSEQNKTEAN